MRFQNPKGTRDFYPEEMARLNRVLDVWRRVSRRHGFVEYDGPTFESFDLLAAKSGEEIREQLFAFSDRGGRELALRPEMTPTLARMVAARAASLPRPIKWFSIPRCYRGERPQRGRLREFFQWNVDIIGSDDVLADAECIFVAVDALRELGLTPDEVVIRLGSRTLLGAVFDSLGIASDQQPPLMAALDKRDKVPAEVFEKMLAERCTASQAEALTQFGRAASVDQAVAACGGSDAPGAAADDVKAVLGWLERMGVAEFCRFDPGIVRGLAYYTGIVWEAFGTRGDLRAVAGGGRYDTLLTDLGGPVVPACGMGMGDVVLGELLGDLDKAPSAELTLDAYVVDAAPEHFQRALEIVATLRRGDASCDFSYRRQSLGKQLKAASARGARYAIIVGDETAGGKVAVKDLQTGTQREVSLAELRADPRAVLLSGPLSLHSEGGRGLG